MQTRLQECAAAKDGEGVINFLRYNDSGVRIQQDSVPNLKIIKQYLKERELPVKDHVARKLVLLKTQFEVIDDVLYNVEPDKTLRLIPPVHCSSKALSKEAHSLCSVVTYIVQRYMGN